MAKVSFGSGGGGGASTGVPIGGAVANTVLFSDASSNLGSVAGFAFRDTMNQSSGATSIFDVDRAVTQSGTAGYNGIRVNVTETSVGSGTRNLFVANLGGAHRFSIRQDGTIWIGPGSTVSTFTPSATTPKLLCQAQVITGGQIGFQWAGNFAGEMTPASGIATYMTIRPNITSSGTGGWTALQILAADGGSGSGTRLQLSIGSGTTAMSVFASGQVTSNGSLSGSSGLESCFSITNTLNQSGTAGYNSLRINNTETATGSGAKRAIHILRNGSFTFAVMNDGKFEIATGNITTTVGAAGGASALPATPLGYISAVTEAGTNIKIPYYNA